MEIISSKMFPNLPTIKYFITLYSTTNHRLFTKICITLFGQLSVPQSKIYTHNFIQWFCNNDIHFSSTSTLTPEN